MSNARALAWRIECSNGLTVTLAVVDKYILLLSQDGSANPDSPWRIGTYMDANEAQRRAIEMTGSYERLRRGQVGEYAEVLLPAKPWAEAVDNGDVPKVIASRIAMALLSPAVSPVFD